MPDSLLLFGVFMLGMALGALLTVIGQKATIARIVREQLEAGSGLQKETPH